MNSNLQTAAVATFVDVGTLVGLTAINTIASGVKAIVYPTLTNTGMLSVVLVSAVEGTHDLIRFYYMKSNAAMPVSGGTTTAG